MSQENEKWTPESGQEVEVLDKHKGIWRKVRVTAVGEDCLLVRWETTETILAKSCSFRPIQTQSDKYQDEQIEKIKNACLNVARADNHYEALYDIGVRVLGPDDVICKPLSQDVRREIAQDLGITISDVMAVERELKLIEGW